MEMSHASKRLCVRPTTTTTILDLNDHVLRETFQHLNASNLCAVADVCSTFKRNAQAEFALQYEGLEFDEFAENCDYYHYNSGRNALRIRRLAPILRNFGPSFVSIGIVFTSALRDQSLHVVKLLIKYCDESLNELNLSLFNITTDVIYKLRPFLSRLQVLKLRNCLWPSESVSSEMFSFCIQLHTLSLSLPPRALCAPVALPTLKSLDVSYSQFQLVVDFLALNPNIKMFKYRSPITLIGIIRVITVHTPQIEKIEIKTLYDYCNGFVEQAKYLKRLTALKSLKISCVDRSFALVLKELAAAHIPLECLELFHIRWDQESVNEITKLKQLKRLKWRMVEHIKLSDILIIVRNLSELSELDLIAVPLLITDLAQIVQCAQKLRKLRYKISETMHEELFIKIRNVVAERKEKCPLVLFLYEGTHDVPKKLLNANKDILNIGRFFFNIWNEE